MLPADQDSLVKKDTITSKAHLITVNTTNPLYFRFQGLVNARVVRYFDGKHEPLFNRPSNSVNANDIWA